MSINYNRDSDFNRPRDFQAYWKQTFAAAQQQISDFGTLPNAATFDGQFRAKIRIAIKEGKLQPLTNYEHHRWILLEEFLTHNMLRASQKPVVVIDPTDEHASFLSVVI